MRYLLDTHVLVWLVGDPGRISVEVRQSLADRSNELLVSAATALEVTTKVRLGKLAAARQLADAWEDRLRSIGAIELAISTRHALLAGTMTWEHRDPFDRILVAQAIVENVPLVTTDRAIVQLPGLQTVTW